MKWKSQVLGEGREIGTLIHTKWECKIVQLLWKLTVSANPYNPAIPFLDVILK